jgi:hypothetical protein
MNLYCICYATIWYTRNVPRRVIHMNNYPYRWSIDFPILIKVYIDCNAHGSKRGNCGIVVSPGK